MKKSFLFVGAMLMTLGAAACAVESEEVQAPEVPAVTPTEGDSKVMPELCPLAAKEGGDLAVSSCQASAPITDLGKLATQPAGDVQSQACSTYYGSCTGISGCSRATGEGWQFTKCGSWLYAWMTVCNGQPSGWGTGFCAW